MTKLKILRPKELAQILSVSAATLWRMEKRGELPPKVNLSKRAVGWKESDIEKWINKNLMDQDNEETGGTSNE